MAITIQVYPQYSPRIIEIKAPTINASVQEIVNACRAWEDSWEGMAYPNLIDAAGKEDLGGGVSVGITATLQNAQIAFEAQNASDSAGTVTTSDTTGKILIDSSATFITDGIVAGDSVLNSSDGSVATVLSVDSETQLTTFGLSDGTDNQFDLSDTYKIWNKVQCEVAGGNLVAKDNLGTTISAFLPTAYTHVVRTSSSSATTQNQENLEHTVYNNGVHVSISGGQAGTAFPIGTRQYPVNNWADAHAIADAKGFRQFYIMESMTIADEDISVHAYTLIGDSPQFTLTIDPSANVAGSELSLLTVTGELDGLNVIKQCSLGAVTNVSGFIEKTAFQSTALVNGPLFVAECYSQVAGTGYPTLTSVGSNTLIIRDYHGSLGIAGMTGGTHSIEIYGGRLVIEADCTGGTVYIRGSHYSDVQDLSGGAVTVVDQTDGARIADSVWDDTDSHTTSGSMGEKLEIAKNKASQAAALSA